MHELAEKNCGLCKRVIVAIILLGISLSLSASSYYRVYTTRDVIYQRVDALCRRAGVIGPSPFSPLSGKDLEIALARINQNTLSEGDSKEYQSILSELSRGRLFSDCFFSFDIDAEVNLAVNIADYQKYDSIQTNLERMVDAILPYHIESPFVRLGAELGFGDNVILEVDYDIRNPHGKMYESSLGFLVSSRSPGRKLINFTFAPEIPFKAGLGVGNEYATFIVGRFPHSIGGGITGNLIVGDNFTYQEISNLSFFSNHFSYSISVTRFDQQMRLNEGSMIDSSENGKVTFFSRNEFQGPQQFRIVHRFDVTLFDRFRISLNLGTIYNSSSAFDIRFFYPFVIGHNYFNYTNQIKKTYFDEANNIMSAELEILLTKGLSIYGQFVVDQFQMYFEGTGRPDVPNSFGVLMNMKYTNQILDGNFEMWLEGVYTSPYLYLNGKTDDSGLVDFNLDYVVGYHMQYLDDYGYSGYPYGPDSIVATFGLGYGALDRSWGLGFNVLWRARGIQHISHKAVNTHMTEIDMENAYVGSDYVMSATPLGGWDTAEHLIRLVVYGISRFDFDGCGYLDSYIAFGTNQYFNFNNINGEYEFVPQLILGMQWTY